MKKLYLILLLLPLFAGAVDYPGNGGGGFGGAIGSSTLAVTDDGTNINFTLTKGAGDFGNVLVIYIDNKLGGGFGSTSGFSDANDGLRRAISGFDGGVNRSIMNFTGSFKPQYAIAAAPVESFGGVWQLANGGGNSLIFRNSVNLTPNNSINSATYTMSLNKADIGITGLVDFNFVATFISNTAFRADEGIGFTNPGTNPGFGNISITSSYGYPSGVLPLSILNLQKASSSELGKLTLTTSDETSVKQYELEASSDAINWQKISTILSKGNLNGSSYELIDSRQLRTIQFYRVKAVAYSGESKLSNVVRISVVNADNISLQSNVVQSELIFNITQDAPASLKISVIDMSGKLVTQAAKVVVSGFSQQRLNVAQLATGMYIVVFEESTDQKYTTRFIKQ